MHERRLRLQRVEATILLSDAPVISLCLRGGAGPSPLATARTPWLLHVRGGKPS